MSRELAKGDLVEIKRMELRGALVREIWIPARVVSVEPGAIAARALNGGAFDDEGHDMIALQPHMGGGKAWR